MHASASACLGQRVWQVVVGPRPAKPGSSRVARDSAVSTSMHGPAIRQRPTIRSSAFLPSAPLAITLAINEKGGTSLYTRMWTPLQHLPIAADLGRNPPSDPAQTVKLLHRRHLVRRPHRLSPPVPALQKSSIDQSSCLTLLRRPAFAKRAEIGDAAGVGPANNGRFARISDGQGRW